MMIRIRWSGMHKTIQDLKAIMFFAYSSAHIIDCTVSEEIKSRQPVIHLNDSNGRTRNWPQNPANPECIWMITRAEPGIGPNTPTVIIIIIIIIAYLYSANFICVSKHNAQKRFIVFIMDWSRNFTYKLSKCFVEQVSFKSGLERVNRWSLLYAEG